MREVGHGHAVRRICQVVADVMYGMYLMFVVDIVQNFDAEIIFSTKLFRQSEVVV